MEERTRILEKMDQSHLKKQKHHIILGERGNQEIHSGTVVEEFNGDGGQMLSTIFSLAPTWLSSGTLAFNRFLATCQCMNTGPYAGLQKSGSTFACV